MDSISIFSLNSARSMSPRTKTRNSSGPSSPKLRHTFDLFKSARFPGDVVDIPKKEKTKSQADARSFDSLSNFSFSSFNTYPEINDNNSSILFTNLEESAQKAKNEYLQVMSTVSDSINKIDPIETKINDSKILSTLLPLSSPEYQKDNFFRSQIIDSDSESLPNPILKKNLDIDVDSDTNFSDPVYRKRAHKKHGHGRSSKFNTAKFFSDDTVSKKFEENLVFEKEPVFVVDKIFQPRFICDESKVNLDKLESNNLNKPKKKLNDSNIFIASDNNFFEKTNFFTNQNDSNFNEIPSCKQLASLLNDSPNDQNFTTNENNKNGKDKECQSQNSNEDIKIKSISLLSEDDIFEEEEEEIFTENNDFNYNTNSNNTNTHTDVSNKKELNDKDFFVSDLLAPTFLNQQNEANKDKSLTNSDFFNNNDENKKIEQNIQNQIPNEDSFYKVFNSPQKAAQPSSSQNGENLSSTEVILDDFEDDRNNLNENEEDTNYLRQNNLDENKEDNNYLGQNNLDETEFVFPLSPIFKCPPLFERTIRSTIKITATAKKSPKKNFSPKKKIQYFDDYNGILEFVKTEHPQFSDEPPFIDFSTKEIEKTIRWNDENEDKQIPKRVKKRSVNQVVFSSDEYNEYNCFDDSVSDNEKESKNNDNNKDENMNFRSASVLSSDLLLLDYKRRGENGFVFASDSALSSDLLLLDFAAPDLGLSSLKDDIIFDTNFPISTNFTNSNVEKNDINDLKSIVPLNYMNSRTSFDSSKLKHEAFMNKLTTFQCNSFPNQDNSNKKGFKIICNEADRKSIYEFRLDESSKLFLTRKIVSPSIFLINLINFSDHFFIDLFKPHKNEYFDKSTEKSFILKQQKNFIEKNSFVSEIPFSDFALLSNEYQSFIEEERESNEIIDDSHLIINKNKFHINSNSFYSSIDKGKDVSINKVFKKDEYKSILLEDLIFLDENEFLNLESCDKDENYSFEDDFKHIKFSDSVSHSSSFRNDKSIALIKREESTFTDFAMKENHHFMIKHGTYHKIEVPNENFLHQEKLKFYILTKLNYNGFDNRLIHQLKCEEDYKHKCNDSFSIHTEKDQINYKSSSTNNFKVSYSNSPFLIDTKSRIFSNFVFGSPFSNLRDDFFSDRADYHSIKSDLLSLNKEKWESFSVNDKKNIVKENFILQRDEVQCIETKNKNNFSIETRSKEIINESKQEFTNHESESNNYIKVSYQMTSNVNDGIVVIKKDSFNSKEILKNPTSTSFLTFKSDDYKNKMNLFVSTQSRKSLIFPPVESFNEFHNEQFNDNKKVPSSKLTSNVNDILIRQEENSFKTKEIFINPVSSSTYNSDDSMKYEIKASLFDSKVGEKNHLSQTERIFNEFGNENLFDNKALPLIKPTIDIPNDLFHQKEDSFNSNEKLNNPPSSLFISNQLVKYDINPNSFISLLGQYNIISPIERTLLYFTDREFFDSKVLPPEILTSNVVDNSIHRVENAFDVLTNLANPHSSSSFTFSTKSDYKNEDNSFISLKAPTNEMSQVEKSFNEFQNERFNNKPKLPTIKHQVEVSDQIIKEEENIFNSAQNNKNKKSLPMPNEFQNDEFGVNKTVQSNKLTSSVHDYFIKREQNLFISDQNAGNPKSSSLTNDPQKDDYNLNKLIYSAKLESTAHDCSICPNEESFDSIKNVRSPKSASFASFDFMNDEFGVKKTIQSSKFSSNVRDYSIHDEEVLFDSKQHIIDPKSSSFVTDDFSNEENGVSKSIQFSLFAINNDHDYSLRFEEQDFDSKRNLSNPQSTPTTDDFVSDDYKHKKTIQPENHVININDSAIQPNENSFKLLNIHSNPPSSSSSFISMTKVDFYKNEGSTFVSLKAPTNEMSQAEKSFNEFKNERFNNKSKLPTIKHQVEASDKIIEEEENIFNSSQINNDKKLSLFVADDFTNDEFGANKTILSNDLESSIHDCAIYPEEKAFISTHDLRNPKSTNAIDDFVDNEYKHNKTIKREKFIMNIVDSVIQTDKNSYDSSHALENPASSSFALNDPIKYESKSDSFVSVHPLENHILLLEKSFQDKPESKKTISSSNHSSYVNVDTYKNKNASPFISYSLNDNPAASSYSSCSHISYEIASSVLKSNDFLVEEKENSLSQFLSIPKDLKDKADVSFSSELNDQTKVNSNEFKCHIVGSDQCIKHPLIKAAIQIESPYQKEPEARIIISDQAKPFLNKPTSFSSHEKETGKLKNNELQFTAFESSKSIELPLMKATQFSLPNIKESEMKANEHQDNPFSNKSSSFSSYGTEAGMMKNSEFILNEFQCTAFESSKSIKLPLMKSTQFSMPSIKENEMKANKHQTKPFSNKSTSFSSHEKEAGMIKNSEFQYSANTSTSNQSIELPLMKSTQFSLPNIKESEMKANKHQTKPFSNKSTSFSSHEKEAEKIAMNSEFQCSAITSTSSQSIEPPLMKSTSQFTLPNVKGSQMKVNDGHFSNQLSSPFGNAGEFCTIKNGGFTSSGIQYNLSKNDFQVKENDFCVLPSFNVSSKGQNKSSFALPYLQESFQPINIRSTDALHSDKNNLQVWTVSDFSVQSEFENYGYMRNIFREEEEEEEEEEEDFDEDFYKINFRYIDMFRSDYEEEDQSEEDEEEIHVLRSRDSLLGEIKIPVTTSNQSTQTIAQKDESKVTDSIKLKQNSSQSPSKEEKLIETSQTSKRSHRYRYRKSPTREEEEEEENPKQLSSQKHQKDESSQKVHHEQISNETEYEDIQRKSSSVSSQKVHRRHASRETDNESQQKYNTSETDHNTQQIQQQEEVQKTHRRRHHTSKDNDESQPKYNSGETDQNAQQMQQHEEGQKTHRRHHASKDNNESQQKFNSSEADQNAQQIQQQEEEKKTRHRKTSCKDNNESQQKDNTSEADQKAQKMQQQLEGQKTHRRRHTSRKDNDESQQKYNSGETDQNAQQMQQHEEGQKTHHRHTSREIDDESQQKYNTSETGQNAQQMQQHEEGQKTHRRHHTSKDNDESQQKYNSSETDQNAHQMQQQEEVQRTHRRRHTSRKDNDESQQKYNTSESGQNAHQMQQQEEVQKTHHRHHTSKDNDESQQRHDSSEPGQKAHQRHQQRAGQRHQHSELNQKVHHKSQQEETTQKVHPRRHSKRETEDGTQQQHNTGESSQKVHQRRQQNETSHQKPRAETENKVTLSILKRPNNNTKSEQIDNQNKKFAELKEAPISEHRVTIQEDKEKEEENQIKKFILNPKDFQLQDEINMNFALSTAPEEGSENLAETEPDTPDDNQRISYKMFYRSLAFPLVPRSNRQFSLLLDKISEPIRVNRHFTNLIEFVEKYLKETDPFYSDLYPLSTSLITDRAPLVSGDLMLTKLNSEKVKESLTKCKLLINGTFLAYSAEPQAKKRSKKGGKSGEQSESNEQKAVCYAVKNCVIYETKNKSKKCLTVKANDFTVNYINQNYNELKLPLEDVQYVDEIELKTSNKEVVSEWLELNEKLRGKQSTIEYYLSILSNYSMANSDQMKFEKVKHFDDGSCLNSTSIEISNETIEKAVLSPSLYLPLFLLTHKNIDSQIVSQLFKLFVINNRHDYLIRSLFLGEISTQSANLIFQIPSPFNQSLLVFFTSLSKEWITSFLLKIDNISISSSIFLKMILKEFNQIEPEAAYIARSIMILSFLVFADTSASFKIFILFLKSAILLVASSDTKLKKCVRPIQSFFSQIQMQIENPKNKEFQRLLNFTPLLLKKLQPLSKNITYKQENGRIVQSNQSQICQKIHSFILQNDTDFVCFMEMKIQNLNDEPKSIENTHTLIYSFYQNIRFYISLKYKNHIPLHY